MVNFIKDIHPIIIDTLVISLFVLVIFFGVIKGIKKTAIDFALFSVALFLGFCPFTNDVKIILVKNVIKIEEWLPAGSGVEYKMAATMFTGLVASLAMFFIFFVIFHLIEVLINILINNKRKETPGKKSKVGRVFGGILAFIYQGFVLVVIMMCFNNNIIGMKEPINDTAVTKFIVKSSSKILNKIDNDASTKIVIKVLKGDVLYKAESETIRAFKEVDEKADKLFNEDSYIEILDDLNVAAIEVQKYLEERLVDIKNIAIIVNELDDFDVAKKEFAFVCEEWLTIMHRNYENRNLNQIELDVNEIGKIRLSLTNAGINDQVIALYDEITVGK